MTPSDPTHRRNKTFVAAADGQPTAEQDTDHSDLDPESTVLIHTSRLYDRVVYHEIGTDGRPICEIGGEFTAISRADAREHTKGRCKLCTRIQTGEIDHRPCPHCGRSIVSNRWPQHVRTCSDPHQRHLPSEAFSGSEQDEQTTEQRDEGGDDP